MYLSKNIDAMRYAKYCGEFLLDHNYPDSKIYVYDTEEYVENDNIALYSGMKKLHLHKLRPNTKYYGVVVAEISVFEKNAGQLTPVRQNKLYYDEFIFITPKY